MAVPTPYEIVRNLVGRPDCLIFDVGANVGQSSEIFQVLFDGCTIHAFEPRREAFDKMQQRLGGAAHVTLNHVALGEAVGSAALHLTTHAESASLLALNTESWFVQEMGIQPTGTETVAVDTIDHYCAAHGIAEIDFLKLDVQGFEPECLRGARTMLAEHRIRVIQAELTCHGQYERRVGFVDLDGILAPHGYRLFTIFNIHIGDTNGELLYLDTVYVRD